ncbi:MAG: class I tRNA ligase family protein, partial [Clostridia bacterium]
LEHTGKIPFKTVYLNGIVKDEQGRKMSKSLGNGIDPIKVINKFGADALRFSLIWGNSAGKDIRYNEEKIESAKNFANKIWNASKFVIMNLKNNKEILNYSQQNLCLEDKWILAKFNTLVKEVSHHFNKLDLSLALEKIYNFVWDEFCDWYIEMVKPRLFNENCSTKLEAEYVLNYVLKNSLKLLHPFMPFITEKIYAELVNDGNSIMTSQIPEYNKKQKYEIEVGLTENLKELIVSIRNARTTMNIHPSQKSPIIFEHSQFDDLIISAQSFILKLGFGSELFIDNSPAINCTTILSGPLKAFLKLDDLIKKDAELARLKLKETKISADLERLNFMLTNSGFLEKAQKSKIEKTKFE